MKKGWKIALISLASLLGLVIVVISVACWLLFTPARLSSIVNKLAEDYLTCENHFERVDLSLFKTYPDVGIDVAGVVLVNPYRMPDSNQLAALATYNDTLAHVGHLTVGIDLRAFLKDRSIIVRQLRLDDVQANLYTAPDGWSNLSVFKSSDTEETVEDTSSSSLPENIQLEKISINHLSAQYCNLQQNMLAQAADLNLQLKGSWVASEVDAKLSMEMERLAVNMADSTGAMTVAASLQKPALTLDARGTLKNLDGNLKLTIPDADAALGKDQYITEAMHQNRHDLLTVKMPFHADCDRMAFTLGEKTTLSLLEYDLNVAGDVALANDNEPMTVDVRYEFDRWQVADLMAVLPSFITSSLKGMSVDGKASISGTAKGVVADGRLPLVDAKVTLSKGSFAAPKMLPMPVKDINGVLQASLNLNSDSMHKGPSRVVIDTLSAKAKKSQLHLSGSVDDLMGDMLVDVALKGQLNLPDLRPFLPEDMPLEMSGSSRADLKVKSRLSEITSMDLTKITAGGTLDFAKLDVVYDSIHAVSPQLRVAVSLPAKVAATAKSKNNIIGARITGGKLDVQMESTGLDAHIEKPDVLVGLPNILDEKQPLAATFNITMNKVNAEMDSMAVNADNLSLKGNIRNDKDQSNIIKQWHPDLDIDLHRGVLSMASMQEPVRLTSFRFNYKPEVCDIAQADILWGVSDYHLNGKVYGLEDWMSHTDMLTGSLNFSSTYADIDQLLAILSGMGTPEDTITQQRMEDDVPKEANPFIVPKDVNVKLNTHIGRCIAFGNDLNDLAGSVTVNDGVAVLDQVGFTCRAARMELTGVYKSPRVNHLFVGLDFHLLDIQFEELLAMVPSIDTLVPMLKAFEGKGNFHLAAECNLNAFYQPKMSTLIGAAAINGKDLVVMDNESIATIAKLLQFKNWREKDNNIGIDSISVEAQVFRKEIIVYPFQLNLHNYQLCIGGRHTLVGNCNYHLELLKCPLPVRLAVDVNGNLSKPSIKLGPVQYADLYKPEKQNAMEARTLEIKRLVRQALEANVRSK
ncbi:MAG: hypothetical protein KBT28_05995 [Bacteroidales bacterium]|nr:hypothetical protein [Candidatus Colimorpha merdihippi]